MPSFVEISDALEGECLGAVFVRSADGTISVFAGTAANLWKLNTATSPYSWDNVSKSTDAYSVPTDDRWSFVLFGTYLIACNLGGTPQYFDIEASSAFADLTGAPVARHVWTAGDFLVFGYLDGEPNKIRWSGLNDATFWTEGQRGADSQVFPTGLQIMGGIGDQRGAVIIHQTAMRYMQFAPSSGYTFTFTEANPVRGAISSMSIVQIGPEQFAYLSEDGFFAGVEGKPIGAERVDRWFLDNLDLDYLENVRGMADPFEKIVWWRFRNIDGDNVLMGYDWQLDRWTYSTQQITEAAAIATPGVSWDGISLLYATIDDVNVPFDSRLFKGGRPAFAGFTTDNKLALATGSNAAAKMDTALLELAGTDRAFANSARAIVNGAVHTVTPGVADYHGDTVTWKDPASPSSRSGRCAIRADGKLHKFRLSYAAGASWSNAIGLEVEAYSAGQI